MDPANLQMIPIYCGVEGETDAGLCSGTENCWAVNCEADEEDIQATLDFMKWVVTSDEGTTMLAEEFGPCPSSPQRLLRTSSLLMLQTSPTRASTL